MFNRKQKIILTTLLVIVFCAGFATGCGLIDKITDKIEQPFLKSAYNGSGTVTINGQEVLQEDVLFDGNHYTWEPGYGARKRQEEAGKQQSAPEDEDILSRTENTNESWELLTFKVSDHSDPENTYDVTIDKENKNANIIETCPPLFEDETPTTNTYQVSITTEEAELIENRYREFETANEGLEKDTKESQLAFAIYLIATENHENATKYLTEWWEEETKNVESYLESQGN